MKQYDLCDSEYRFANLVWENEPINSGDLVKISLEKLGWKKSTTYTVLKKLCDKSILRNENAMVSSIINREYIQKFESEEFMEKTFSGSLPQFIASFMSDKKISKSEAEHLQKLIDSFKED